MIEEQPIVQISLPLNVTGYLFLDMRKPIQVILKFLQSHTLRIVIAV